MYPAKRLNRHSVAGSQFMAGRVVPIERAPVRRSNTMPPNLGNSGILGRANVEERVPGGKGPFIVVTRATGLHQQFDQFRSSACNSLWPLCHSGDFSLSLLLSHSLYHYIFLCFLLTPTLDLFEVFPSGEFFWTAAAPCLLCEPSFFFLSLYKHVSDAFGCDLMLYK